MTESLKFVDQALEPGRRRAVIDGSWKKGYRRRIESDVGVDRLSFHPGHDLASDLEFLAELPQIRSFTLALGSRCDVRALARCPWLEYIGLVHWQPPLPDLNTLPRLRTLSLSHRPGAEAVLGLSALHLLAYEDFPYEDFTRVTGLRELRELMVSAGRLRTIAGVGRFGKLRRLRLSECRKLRDMRGLDSLHALQVLEVYLCSAVPDFEELGRIAGLEDVYVRSRGTVPSLRPLVACTQLKKLQLEKVVVADGSIAFLAEVGSLRDFWLTPPGDYDMSVKSLFDLMRRRRLEDGGS